MIHKTRKGFTILEILIVLAVIAILSSVILASLNTARDKAKLSHTESELVELERAITMLSLDTNKWPGDQVVNCADVGGAGNEIEDLSVAEAGLTQIHAFFNNWEGPYMKFVPTDPWGNNYFFDTDYDVSATEAPCAGGGGCVTVAVVGSYGPDGIGNNLYNADDIIRVVARTACP